MARTVEKDKNNLKWTGAALMVIAIWSALDAIGGLMSPASVNIAGIPLPHDTVVFATLGIGIVLDAIEFYFGLVAYQLRVSKTVAMISLIVGILLLIGSFALIAAGDGLNFGGPLCCGIVAIAYYVYSKRVINEGSQHD